MLKSKTICAVLMMFAASTASGQTSRHVDGDNCPGPGTGTLVDPFCSIQAGIDAAANGDTVLVAAGTYNEVINFNGKAITLRSSTGAAVTTIDGTGLSSSVVRCISGEESDTVLTGFTVTGGTGVACPFYGTCGGGMYNLDSSPTVTHCTFSGNTVTSGGGGGGMYNGGNSSPTVIGCLFAGNSAGWAGGGMYSDLSSSTVTNCMFSGNAASDGAGMYNTSSRIVTVTNCTFSGNTAGWQGGGISNSWEDRATVTNCILWGDSPNEFVGGPASPSAVSFSDVQGGLPAGTIDGGGNIDADPLFVDADGADDTVGTEDDDFRLLPGSPAIDAGDTSAYAGFYLDVGGNVRAVDDPATPDTGIVGAGPAYPFSSSLVIDMGAHEFPVTPFDYNHDGLVDLNDFVEFLKAFTGP